MRSGPSGCRPAALSPSAAWGTQAAPRGRVGDVCDAPAWEGREALRTGRATCRTGGPCPPSQRGPFGRRHGPYLPGWTAPERCPERTCRVGSARAQVGPGPAPRPLPSGASVSTRTRLWGRSLAGWPARGPVWGRACAQRVLSHSPAPPRHQGQARTPLSPGCRWAGPALRDRRARLVCCSVPRGFPPQADGRVPGAGPCPPSCPVRRAPSAG